MKKEILIGFVIGILATIAGFYLYVEFFSDYEFSDAMKIIHKDNLYGKILGLAAIPNLFVFFVFLKKNQDQRAKGVLMATIVIALTMLIMKFF
jgi:hypothetical protein